MKAWLVKWASSSGEEALADILSARLGPKAVGCWMERLYSQVTASAWSRIFASKRPKTVSTCCTMLMVSVRKSIGRGGRTYTLLAGRSERHALYKQRDPG